MMNFDSVKWTDLLTSSIDTTTHISRNDALGGFQLSNEIQTGQKIKKLNLNQIIDQTFKIDSKILVDKRKAIRLASSMTHMAEQTEQKYFSGNRSLLKIFNVFWNFLSGRGFQSTISRARQLAETFSKAAQSTVYKKGERTEIPVKEVLLGKGGTGTVYEHREDSTLVVKQSLVDLDNEFTIGLRLDHPNIVKIRDLYVEESHYQEPGRPPILTHRLLMDKVEGRSLNSYLAQEKVPAKTAIEMIRQAKNCCLYLFKEKVCWGDLKAENVFITSDHNLMLIDFGLWTKNTDPLNRTKELLLDANWLISTIIESSSLHSKLEAFRDTEIYKDLKNIEDKIKEMNAPQLLTFIASYFDEVIGFLKTQSARQQGDEAL